jgi:PAS domain S-box-containing protein
LHLSEEWYRLYGFDPNEGIPDWNKPVQRMHPHDRARWQQVFDRAISEKSDYEAEYRIHLPDGAVRHIHSVGHPVLDTSGKLVQFVGSSSDVTERKQAEEALRQAQADLARTNRVTTMGELTASLAHEINQPIAAAATDANTCLRWLTRDQPDLEEARAAASRVVKDAARAAEIMSRIRSLFKKEISQRELVDVNDILQGMIELLRSEATRYAISVRTELSDDLPQIMGDRVQLQQVTMNLIINSIDAMKDVEGTREIIITSQQAENEQLQVSVSDTGVGLPAEQGNRSSRHSSRPSLTAPEWDFASASQSLSRMAAGYGRPTTLRAAPASISHYPVLAQRSRSRSADTGLRCGQPKPAAIRRKPGTKIGRRRICRSGAEVTLAADQSVNRVSALTITVNCPIPLFCLTRASSLGAHVLGLLSSFQERCKRFPILGKHLVEPYPISHLRIASNHDGGDHDRGLDEKLEIQIGPDWEWENRLDVAAAQAHIGSSATNRAAARVSLYFERHTHFYSCELATVALAYGLWCCLWSAYGQLSCLRSAYRSCVLNRIRSEISGNLIGR